MLTINLLGNSRRFIGMFRDIKIIIRAPLKTTLKGMQQMATKKHKYDLWACNSSKKVLWASLFRFNVWLTFYDLIFMALEKKFYECLIISQ